MTAAGDRPAPEWRALIVHVQGCPVCREGERCAEGRRLAEVERRARKIQCDRS